MPATLQATGQQDWLLRLVAGKYSAICTSYKGRQENVGLNRRTGVRVDVPGLGEMGRLSCIASATSRWEPTLLILDFFSVGFQNWPTRTRLQTAQLISKNEVPSE